MADAQEEILQFRVSGGQQARAELENLTSALATHRAAVDDYNRVVGAGGTPDAAQRKANQVATFPSGTYTGQLNYEDAAKGAAKLTTQIAEVEKAERALSSYRANQTGRPQLAAAQGAAEAQYGRTHLDAADPTLSADLGNRQQAIDALLAKAQRARSPQNVMKWTQQAEREIDALAQLQDVVYSRPFPDAARRVSDEVKKRADSGNPFSPTEFAQYKAAVAGGQMTTTSTDPDVAEELARNARGEYRLVPHKNAKEEIEREARARRKAGTPFTAEQFEAFKEETNRGKYVSNDTDPYLKEEMEHAQRGPLERVGAAFKKAYSLEGLKSQFSGFSAGYAALNLGEEATSLAHLPLSGDRYTSEAMSRQVAGLAPGFAALVASPLGPGASLGAAGVTQAGVGIFTAMSERDEKVRLASEDLSRQLGKGTAAAGDFAKMLGEAAGKTGVPLAELAENVRRASGVVGTLGKGGVTYQANLAAQFQDQYPELAAAQLDFAGKAPMAQGYREMVRTGVDDPNEYRAAATYEALHGNLDAAYKQGELGGNAVDTPEVAGLKGRLKKDDYDINHPSLIPGYNVYKANAADLDESDAQQALDAIPAANRKQINPLAKDDITKFFEETRLRLDQVDDAATKAGTFGTRGQEALGRGEGQAGLAPQTNLRVEQLADQREKLTAERDELQVRNSKLTGKARSIGDVDIAKFTGQIEAVNAEILGAKNEVFRSGLSESAATFNSRFTRQGLAAQNMQQLGGSVYDPAATANYTAREGSLTARAGVLNALATGKNHLTPEERQADLAQAEQLKVQANALRVEQFHRQLSEDAAKYTGAQGRQQIAGDELRQRGGSAFGADYGANYAERERRLGTRADTLDRLANDKTNFLSPQEREADRTEAAAKRLEQEQMAQRLFQEKVGEAGAKSENRTSALNIGRAVAETTGSHVQVYAAENKLLDEQIAHTRELGQLLQNAPNMPLVDRLRIQTEINNSIAQEVVQRKNLTEQVLDGVVSQAQTSSAVGSTRASRLELTQGSSPQAVAARMDSFREAQNAVAGAQMRFDAEDDPKRKAERQLQLEQARSAAETAMTEATAVVESPETRTQRMRLEAEEHRQQMSPFEKGAPITEAAKLNRLDQEELRKIEERRRQLRAQKMLTPETEERLVAQEEPIKTGILERQNQMNLGWMDRLVAMSVGSASFTSRIMPAPSDVAALAEAKGLGPMSARVFGGYQKKSFEDSTMMGFLPSEVSRYAFGQRPGDIVDAGGGAPYGVAADGGGLSAPLAETPSGMHPGAGAGDKGFNDALNTLTAAIQHGFAITVTLANPTTGQQQAVVVNAGANQDARSIMRGGNGPQARTGQGHTWTG